MAVTLLGSCSHIGISTIIPESSGVRVYEQRLENGLKVLVKPDHRAPVVVSQIWYKVGASYEPKGLTGMSHVLEHMMFKGTRTTSPNEFSRIIAAQGGRENAFTGADYTAYFQTLEKSRLPISFKLESDRMHNLVLTEEEFRKEIEVVKEERRLRTDDKPEALTYERFMATVFTHSNYHNPIIGWAEDLSAITVDDLQDWYQRYYVPNNATLVVVGDVDPDAVFKLAAQTYGLVKSRPVSEAPNPTDAAQVSTRRITVKAAARVPYVLMGYRVPTIATAVDAWEPYALDILAYILDGGKSARLQKHLVRERTLVSSVGVGYNPGARSETVFYLNANPVSGASLESIETALVAELEGLKSALISSHELDRVKATIVASDVYERDSVFYQGMKLGRLETVGLSWQLDSELTKRLKQITPQQVQAVVKKYFKPENLTVAYLQPEAGT